MKPKSSETKSRTKAGQTASLRSGRLLELNVEYTGGFSPELDKKIEAICGRRHSSGCGCGARDMQFRVREWRLPKIKAALRRHKNVSISLL